MRFMTGTVAVLVAFLLAGAGVQRSYAQDPKGIVLCIAGCSKSDKGCQDQCIPSRGLRSGAKACIETCRRDASEPDLVVGLTRCISLCLGGDVTQ